MGITKPVTLNAKFNKSGVSFVNDRQTIGFEANTNILRSDFGIKYALPGVADKVDLLIQVEANQ
jgi:polyisoprenoid-binding protein YceI